MEKLKKEIHTLVDKLEKGFSDEKSIEYSVLIHLKRLLQVMEGSDKNEFELIGALFSELRQFWLDSVPWCSELSKDIEKLIIMFSDIKQ
jgi:hypothetical protein